MGMISNKKNDVLIEYPVEGLDLSEYVVGEHKDEAIYDLVAISQHFGSLSSGHYTALCKNFKKWYDFDDSSVGKADTSEIVNSAAYMLFYKKRNLSKMS
jgi:ubiquitin C-terminal hydrolase